MTLHFRFTDGVADGTAVSQAYDATRTNVTVIAKPTTRDAVWLAIDAALVAAGWTTHVAGGSVAGARDVTYFSSGEVASSQHICIRITTDTSGRFVNFFAGTKLDSSSPPVCDGAIGGGAVSHDRWDIGTDDVPDWEMQILVDLDGIWVVMQRDTVLTSDVIYTMFLGVLRPFDANPSTFTSGAAASSTDNVVLTPTAGDPVASGYKPGDLLQIVETDPASAAAAETQIITKVSSTTIEIRRLNASYTAPRFGGFPSGVVRWVGTNQEIESTANITAPLIYSNIDGDDMTNAVNTSGLQVYDIVYSILNTNTAAVQQGFGIGTTPNQNSLRFVCRTTSVIDLSDAHLGCFPKLHAYPGTPPYYPHDTDNYVRDRVTPVEDYGIMRFTSTSLLDYVIGPTPP